MVESVEIPTAAFTYYPRLRKIKEHADQHLADDMSLGTAARIAGLEEKYFSTYFREKTGICYKDWITRARVEWAAEMMNTQDQLITGIAFAVGFRDLRTFERAFKKWMGTTPRKYKKSVQPR